jgi:3-dehydroquinate dehydratase-2
LGCEVTVFQSNHEGALIDRLHAAIGRCDGIVINPGALTHYSYALHDAIEAVAIPAIEVHLSDITTREPWRATSVIAPACRASISGQGTTGYRRAMEMLVAARS